MMPHGIGEIPIMNVENACAGGSSAFHGAYLGIAAGAYDIALAVGVDKTYVPPTDPEGKKRAMESFISGTDVEVTVATLERMKQEAEERRKQMEAEGGESSGDKPAARSPFMDMYSNDARAHMEKYGTTQEQLAYIAAKNHFHGSLNPNAQYQFDMTVEEVLNDRMVSHPLTRSMCAPMGDGAAAAILVSERMLAKLGISDPIKVRASILGSAKLSEKRVLPSPIEKAYNVAGVGPEDISLGGSSRCQRHGRTDPNRKPGFLPNG